MKRILSVLMVVMLSFFCSAASANWFHQFYAEHLVPFQWTRGIYLRQYSVENSRMLRHFIQEAQAADINTFVIDFDHTSKAFERNIHLVKDAGIRYVARVVVFPGGGTAEQVKSKAYWYKRLDLMLQAASLGADAIQLDYIRYQASTTPSKENATDIAKVLAFFKGQLGFDTIPLQVDVFGIAAFHPSNGIGQDVKKMGLYTDAMCPMLYPSHYQPYEHYSADPYRTVFSSLKALHKQLHRKLAFKVYPFIEIANYHYHFTPDEKYNYVYNELKAVKDGGADGWYAWSAGNKYQALFRVLKDHGDSLYV